MYNKPFLKKFKKMELTYDVEFPLLSIYLKELKAETQTSMCTPMFTAALFIKAKMWKYPKCPLMDK